MEAALQLTKEELCSAFVGLEVIYSCTTTLVSIDFPPATCKDKNKSNHFSLRNWDNDRIQKAETEAKEPP
jgi:predicted kinase